MRGKVANQIGFGLIQYWSIYKWLDQIHSNMRNPENKNKKTKNKK
uniref:Uncharacterized protein n=1 Tax=Nelumbo nucifera TaxID=4432 RepID=A0A822Y4X0_NELNU|nr:TPA_asm: hypothetical protein HUJ06_028965 [Nelumbo nucifera]